MHRLYVLLLPLLFSLTANAQVNLQFAPALNIGAGMYEGNGHTMSDVMFNMGGRLRLIGDYHRIQFGGGIDVHTFRIDIDRVSDLTYDPINGGYSFICPQFNLACKFPFKKNHNYFYTGVAVGAGITTQRDWAGPINGLTGADLGFVINLSKRLDLEVSESWRTFVGKDPNGHTAIPNTQPEINSTIYTYIFTTNIGIRLKRVKQN